VPMNLNFQKYNYQDWCNISWEEFYKCITNYVSQIKKLIAHQSLPFLQKKIIPTGATLIFVSDLHGDFKTLWEIIIFLKKEGILSPNLELTQNCYLIALGDYVNRGAQSVPVLSLLCNLYSINPNQVVLLRGGHEVSICNKIFESKQLQAIRQNNTNDIKNLSTPFLQELRKRFGHDAYSLLYHLFESFPIELFIGTQSTFLRCCHSGLELGYNPQNFLCNTAQEFYTIDSLDRARALNHLALAHELEEIRPYITRMLNIMKNAGGFDYYLKSVPINLYKPHCLYSLRFGTFWNNFLTQDNDNLEIAASTYRHCLFLGEKVTKYFLHHIETKETHCAGIFRGHQHMDEIIPDIGLESKMRTLIIQNKGVVKQWDGLLYTLGSSDSTTGYQSFVTITCTDEKSNWPVIHYFKKPEEENFSKTIL